MYLYFSARRGESCSNCISARVCMTSGVTYLNFSVLFNHSLTSGSKCELYVNTDPLNILTEDRCVEVSSNMSYYIVCPICHEYEVYYEIPNSTFFNIADCSDSGIY